MKKYFVILLIILSSLLQGCIETQNTVSLPDLTGMNRAEITKILEELKILFTFQTKSQIYNNESEYDQFIEYGGDLKANSVIPRNQYIYVYTSVLPLTLNRLNELVLESDYLSSSFINDGAGLVTLSRTIDGDTAIFIDSIAKKSFSCRFLGIDTPETYNEEAWGKKASSYTASRLKSAQQIVLVSEGKRLDNYERYLAWVWVDGELLNLDIVQQAYSNAKVASSSKYFKIFNEVEIEIAKTGRRIWGEIDPDFKYK